MESRYIYCIITAGRNEKFDLSIAGMEGAIVYPVSFDGVTAMVSSCGLKEYPVSRQNLLTHEKVIEEVMRKYTVVPVRFGTIAVSEEKVKKILEKEGGKFKDLLEFLEGKKELGLKAIFSAKGETSPHSPRGEAEGSGGKEVFIYEEILQEYPDIKALKEKIQKLPPVKTHYQRMEIGKMVESALEKKKDFYKEDILKSLSSLADKFKINKVYGERMILNVAFLVEEANEKEFDRQVNALDEKYGDKIKFKYVGWVPPFNFVDLAIEAGRY
ncbi:MAG: GvpL/GvpF family gas vesicle protein [Candidatus Omnitrophica bacterium]|nr:GvpL/GvpF family gas vesicle protein [Candidatus Omnitrophota bacterium]